MKAKIKVMLKKSILDPQGKAVLHAIQDMKLGNVSDVRIGKYIEVTFADGDKKAIEADANKICDKLLANTVMENFEIEIGEDN